MGIADKARNAAQDIAGKAKEVAGDATNDDKLKAEGKKDQSRCRPQAGRRERQGRLQEVTRT